METRGLWKLILLALFLNIVLIMACECLPLHEWRKIATEHGSPVPNERRKKEAGMDIFDIILKANSARSNKLSSPEGMMESRATEEDTKLFQGDIVMTKAIQTALENSHTDILTLMSVEQDGQRRKKRGVTAHVEKKWPIVNGQVEVPYVIETSSAADKTVILEAMNHWHAKVPCIAFVPWNNQLDYLSFFAGQGCYSWVGRKGGKQRISIGQGCAVMGVIAHEIGHALGFWHEQSRPDRDKYVRILWNNILSVHLDDFKMINNTDTNDLGVDYDLASLMHYGPRAFSKSPASLSTIESLDGSTNFGQRNGLSDKDIEQARLLYCPRTNACTTLYTDLNPANCSTWEALGYCENKTYASFMYINCKKTCICKVCEDKHSKCSVFSQAGYCTNDAYKDWMAVNCKKTCSLCR